MTQRHLGKQCDLGEVIGTIMPPMNPIRRVQRRNPRWIEDGTALAVAVVFSAVMSMLVMLAVYASFMLAGTSPVG